MTHKNNRKKRKKKRRSSIIVNASNVSNSSINIASDSSAINFSKDKPSKLEKYITLGAGVAGITGISIASIGGLSTPNSETVIDSTTIKNIPSASRTIEKRTHTIDSYREYTKDCTIVTIHKGDTIIKCMNHKKIHKDSI